MKSTQIFNRIYRLAWLVLNPFMPLVQKATPSGQSNKTNCTNRDSNCYMFIRKANYDRISRKKDLPQKQIYPLLYALIPAHFSVCHIPKVPFRVDFWQFFNVLHWLGTGNSKVWLRKCISLHFLFMFVCACGTSDTSPFPEEGKKRFACQIIVPVA